MATRADVARLAGVSESTVSYAMSGVRSVSDETKARVEAAMAQLSYTPNLVARSLAARRTDIVAWHFPVAERGLSYTESEYILAATEQAHRLERHLLLWTSARDEVAELGQLARQHLVDGVVLTEVVADDERIGVLQEAGLPFVLVGRTKDPSGLTFVDADFDEMADTAVDHLADLGHERVVFISPAEQSAIGYGPVMRLRPALAAATRRRGLRMTDVQAGPTIRSGWDALPAILAAGATAVLGLNEFSLVGVLEAALDRRLRVPQDLSLVALGVSAQAADMTHPRLTTVCASGTTIGQVALTLLAECIDGQPPRHLLVASDLHLGASTAPAAASAIIA